MPLKERPHDGEEPWRGNNDAACEALCFSGMPTRAGGEEAAEWNAFDGHWGTAKCQWRFFCSSTDAPRGPSMQSRYKEPWCATRALAFIRGEVTIDPQPPCPKEEHKELKQPAT
ncbi:MAG: hypothetical protein M3401_13895 [Actinomycetota bacterium]|nr:hypothetical protein [Actinomycetota bacterium]